MAQRRARSPLRWVGYYLPAPCYTGTSWMGLRAALERMGWGMAVRCSSASRTGRPATLRPPTACRHAARAPTASRAAPRSSSMSSEWSTSPPCCGRTSRHGRRRSRTTAATARPSRSREQRAGAARRHARGAAGWRGASALGRIAGRLLPGPCAGGLRSPGCRALAGWIQRDRSLRGRPRSASTRTSRTLPLPPRRGNPPAVVRDAPSGPPAVVASRPRPEIGTVCRRPPCSGSSRGPC